MDGRFHDSGDIHLFVMEITTKRDSFEQVACTTASTICFHPSSLFKDACKMYKFYEGCFYIESKSTQVGVEDS